MFVQSLRASNEACSFYLGRGFLIYSAEACSFTRLKLAHLLERGLVSYSNEACSFTRMRLGHLIYIYIDTSICICIYIYIECTWLCEVCGPRMRLAHLLNRGLHNDSKEACSFTRLKFAHLLEWSLAISSNEACSFTRVRLGQLLGKRLAHLFERGLAI